ncbi:MAG: hypothetical protein Q4D78_11565 [Neisseria zoodegmatis]|uniref:hypothetical protein n=1 Tax=Neisseria zoodegmatis TaxID=326523 RepID=UPI0026F0EA7A|nr:hypothetical protein [Neisseria zoodegmatis]MDO5070808.1 hypothetical protein [Neisseria zoodegmatis]
MDTNKNIPTSMEGLLKAWQTNGKTSAASLFIYLVMGYFNIHRLPTLEDRIIQEIKKNGPENNFYTSFSDLNLLTIETELQERKKDFELLYEDTQKRLKKQFDNQKKIKLSRRFGELKKGKDTNKNLCDRWQLDICEICSYINGCKEKNKEIIFEMDILNSWAETPSYSYGDIIISKEIPIEDIIYFQHSSDCLGPLENDEYIVLNRQETGCVRFAPSEVEIDPRDRADYNDLKKDIFRAEIRAKLNKEELSCIKNYLDKGICIIIPKQPNLVFPPYLPPQNQPKDKSLLDKLKQMFKFDKSL